MHTLDDTVKDLLNTAYYVREELMEIWLREGPYTTKLSQDTKQRLNEFFNFDDAE